MQIAVQLWVLTGVVSILSTVLLIIFKISLQRLIGRLDSLIEEVKELRESTSVHSNSIDHLRRKNMEQDKWLQEHSERIRVLEINQNKSN